MQIEAHGFHGMSVLLYSQMCVLFIFECRLPFLLSKLVYVTSMSRCMWDMNRTYIIGVDAVESDVALVHISSNIDQIVLYNRIQSTALNPGPIHSSLKKKQHQIK